MHSNIKDIRASTEYMTWKTAHIQLVANRSIQEVLKKDDLLKYFLCPISKIIPELPVRLMGGDNIGYDYEALIKWVNQNPNKSPPGENSSLIFEQELLQFDFTHVNFKAFKLLN